MSPDRGSNDAIQTFEPVHDLSGYLSARRLLTVEEAAHELAVGRTLMYRLLRTGALESIRVGRLRRIPVDAIVAFVEQRRENTGQPVADPSHEQTQDRRSAIAERVLHQAPGASSTPRSDARSDTESPPIPTVGTTGPGASSARP